VYSRFSLAIRNAFILHIRKENNKKEGEIVRYLPPTQPRILAQLKHQSKKNPNPPSHFTRLRITRIGVGGGRGKEDLGVGYLSTSVQLVLSKRSPCCSDQVRKFGKEHLHLQPGVFENEEDL